MHYPTSRPVCILALDAKDRLLAMEWMETIANPNFQAMEQRRDPSMVFLVSLEPKTQHKRGKSTGYKFIRDVDSGWDNSRRSSTGSRRLSGNVGK